MLHFPLEEEIHSQQPSLAGFFYRGHCLFHLHIVLFSCVSVNGNIIIPSSWGSTTPSLLGDILSSFYLTGRGYYKCRRLPE